MRALALLLCCSATAGWLYGTPADTTYYSYVNKGKVVGVQWIWQKEQNDYYCYDEYNDRGRGPAVHGHIRTDDEGRITGVEFSGVDYYKSQVKERFSVQNGKAYWKNKFEDDSAAYHGELYSDINGPMAEYSLIFPRLQDAPGQTLSVLPAGTRQC
jgi:hypothetical protein